MKSKRIIILTIAAAVIACSKPVFAKEAAKINNALANTSATTQTVTSKISKEQAKQIAEDALKDYFDITIDESTANIDIDSRLGYYNGQADKSSWNVNFNINNGSTHHGGFVSIDKNTGRIIGLNSYDDNEEVNKPKVPTVTYDQAQATAEAFISKIAPEEFKSMKLIKNNEPKALRGQNFLFSYNRLNNDIPVYGDSIYITVNGFTGKVDSYSIHWTDNASLPSEEGIIDSKKGTDLVSANTKMNLAYITPNDNLNPEIEKDTKIVYTNDLTTQNIIDAKTGEVVSLDKFTGAKIKSKDITAKEKEDIYNSSQSTKKSYTNLTSDEAKEIAKEKLKLIYNEDLPIGSAGYGTRSSGFNGKTIKTFDFSFDPKCSNNGSICINASTGEVMDIFIYYNDSVDSEETFKPKLTGEEAYDKSIQIISKLYPEKIKDIKTEQTIPDSSTSNSYTQMNSGFNFQRLVNNIPYKHDGINFNFSAKTGELLNLNCDWEDSVSAPAISNTISADDAKKAFLSNNVPELMYMITPTDKNSESTEKEGKLVYSINTINNDCIYVDAFTGKALNYLGQESDNSLSNFQAAVKGSSVEKEAVLLASNGIIDTKDFKLDGNITKLQFIKLLTNIKNSSHYYRSGPVDLKISTSIAKDSTDYKYLQMAVGAGILDNSGEFNPSDLVTREQAAVYLVKLLQYDRIGKLTDVFNFQPSDKASISSDCLGYLALAKSLGLIDLDSNNSIRPKDNITMEEVIKAVYKTIE